MMSVADKSPSPARDIDPLLKDLNEKKQSFRRNVVSLAAELKEVRTRLASQEQSFARETLTRQEAETKAKGLEEEIRRLQKRLDERNEELQASASTAEKYTKELDDLRSQLASTQATADASTASAESAQFQCLALLKELDEKNRSLKDHEDRVNKLAEQLDYLQKDLQAREFSQRQLKDEVLKIEQDIMQAVARAGVSKDSELRRMLDEVSPKNIDKLNKLLDVKDEEIAKLKDEIRVMTAHWKMKTKDLESQVFLLIQSPVLYLIFTINPPFGIKEAVSHSSTMFKIQLERQRRADQELKKRVLKLEFCLQEARAQMRKLQRTGERREKTLKELREQLAGKQQQEDGGVSEKQNFWETPCFKIMVSMSMLILVVFSKR
ncbi:nuclear envelope-associated protein 2-like isoform X1 [Punica granatum]|uniref:Nuclear envelope-associated protein 2-like isoform X1 n=1 Tax=Punica granatum TaxID=22663 RepID=A0A6P8E4D6_PUNGR|nr:nuclear envelope-associated protein 2-like isoform X1 [Punica granatum]XP_031399796.1 nuclear envelope-associated protein 2-like isoform X1 [Punica granatum]XP_031399803.1 nuclear envelope-associated protein 2-like isoform X1 [Punica granatum]